jgi:hypothetical protein
MIKLVWVRVDRRDGGHFLSDLTRSHKCQNKKKCYSNWRRPHSFSMRSFNFKLIQLDLALYCLISS